MKLSTAIGITLAVLATTVSAGDITYKVISHIPGNQTLGVIVDDKVYSLENVDKASSLLHYGKAPAAESGYKYAILQKDSNQVISSENFTRASSNDDTLNEYYGRSWNTFANLTALPTILPPISAINHIKSDLHIDNQIPTIHFIGNQTAIDNMHNNQMQDIDVHLDMAYISPKDVKKFEGARISISGQSTRGMPKLSYKLKLPKKSDLYGYRRLKLRSMSVDLSMMKENLAYNSVKSIGLPSSGHSYVRVYINDQAIGLFGLVEHMKSTWVRNMFGDGSKKFKQGALYLADVNAGKSINASTSGSNEKKNDLSKRDDAAFPSDILNSTGSITDLSYLGSNVSAYSIGQYSVKEEPSVGTANFTRIMELTKFISEQPTTPTNNSVISLWQERIDVDSFLRGLAFEVAVSNIDGYLGISNNYMLYDDISTDRLVFSAQDLDLTMGITTSDVNKLHGGDYTKFPGVATRPLTTRMLQVPQFKQDFENLILNMTKELINPTVYGTRIDQLFAMLSEDVAWDYNLPRAGKSLLPQGFDTGSIDLGGNNNGTNGTNGSDDIDYFALLSKIPYERLVYGPSFANISMAINEWLNMKSANTLSYFNQTS